VGGLVGGLVGEVTEHKMCVVLLSINFVCNISLSNKNSAIYLL
jgi:hypothetical protein